MQFQRVVVGAIAMQLLVAPVAVAMTAVDSARAEGTDRRSRESRSHNRDGQAIWGYVALETKPVDCSQDTDPWACAERDWQGLRDWYSHESQRLRDLRNSLSWATAFGAGCLVVIGEKSGTSTSKACIITSLVPLIYDDLTVINYRKKLVDKASEVLDGIRNRYRVIQYHAASLAKAKVTLNSREISCDQVGGDIIRLDKLPQGSATKSVKKELTSLYNSCIAHREYDREILDIYAKFERFGPIVQSYISNYNRASTDVYNAYNDTVATPNETFSTLIAAPFSAISKALKDGAGLQSYTSKRARSPDVFNFNFPALVEIAGTARPLPPDALREGLSEDAQGSLEEIATNADLLAKAKLAESDIREMAAHARALGNALADRLPDVAAAKAALDGLRTACAPYSVTIDLRAAPVEGATPPKE